MDEELLDTTKPQPRRRRRTILLATTALAAIAAAPIAVHATAPGSGGPPMPYQSPKTAPAHAPNAGCPGTKRLPDGHRIAIDYVDMVRFFGHDYIHDWGRGPGEHPRLGRLIGHVTCTVSSLTEDGAHTLVGRFRDGSATFLPVGTQLRVLPGQDPHCVIGAVHDGAVTIYLIHGRHATCR